MSKCHLIKCHDTFSLPFLIKFSQATDNIWSLVFVKMSFDQMSLHFFSPLLMKFPQVTDNILLISICQNVIWKNVSEPFLSELSMKFFHWHLIFCWFPFVKMSFDEMSQHLFSPLLDKVFASDRQYLIIGICQNVIWSNVSTLFLPLIDEVFASDR